jgi:gluconolactonase
VTIRPTKIADVAAHEGPVYVAEEHALYYTTVPRDLVVDIERLDLATGAVSTVRADANMANGMTLAPDGRLLVCEQGKDGAPACISAVDRASGTAERVVDAELNSPNDVVVARDGSMWFTDPSYGYLQGFRPPPRHRDAVYRWDGELTVVADHFDKPNGLAFSPDERVLYVGDSSRDHVRANGAHFAAISPGHPDGLKVAGDGRVFVSFGGGVLVLSERGERLDVVDLPGAVNFCFGDGDLYITADSAVWVARGVS